MPNTDATTTIAEMKHAMTVFAHERDWEQFHAPKNLSMAISAEAGELMEHFLWIPAEDSAAHCANPAKKPKIEEELADIILFTLQFANMAKIDIATAVEAKIAKNALKYPIEKAKGRSEKYTEL